MSRLWSLSIQGTSAEAVTVWLSNQSDAERDTEHPDHIIFDLARAAAHARVSVLKPPEVAGCVESWGVTAATRVYMSGRRNADPEVAHLAMYKVAFDALRHFPADIAFAVDDVGIFARRGGRLTVNSESFKSPEINALLEPPFWLADDPCHLLIRSASGQPNG
jgi:hypothetical protein